MRELITYIRVFFFFYFYFFNKKDLIWGLEAFYFFLEESNNGNKMTGEVI